MMDVVVLPSLEEGFLNAVVEDMAAAKPIVASRVGGVPEATIDRETGLLIPPKDSEALANAILELLRDPARAEQLGKAGRARVEAEFRLDRMIRRTEKMYQQLLQVEWDHHGDEAS